MNTQQAAPLGEATLWRLYRRLLGEHLFEQRLRALRTPKCSYQPGSGIAAALTENLLPGDTLGVAPTDLAIRYLCGQPLEQLHAAAMMPPKSRKIGGWLLPADREHGLLPGTEQQQASFAVGAALAATLHRSGGVTVLVDNRTATASARFARSNQQGPPAPWLDAVGAAVAFHLPILFITPSAGAAPAGPKRPAPATPAIPVDRYDTLALYRVLYESFVRARSGGGPTWITCCAWALTLEGDTEPKPPAESALEKMEQALRSRRLFDRRQQRHLERTLEREFTHAGWPHPAAG